MSNKITKDSYPAAPVSITQQAPYRWLMPVISSSHFTEDDCAVDGPLFGIAIYTNEDGFILDISSLDAEEKEEVSKEGQAVIAWALGLGYVFLRIDGEVGDEIEGLPTFDW